VKDVGFSAFVPLRTNPHGTGRFSVSLAVRRPHPGHASPQGAAQAASWFFISAPPHGLWHLPMPQRAKPAQLLQAQHHGRSLRNPYGADKKVAAADVARPAATTA